MVHYQLTIIFILSVVKARVANSRACTPYSLPCVSQAQVSVIYSRVTVVSMCSVHAAARTEPMITCSQYPASHLHLTTARCNVSHTIRLIQRLLCATLAPSDLRDTPTQYRYCCRWQLQPVRLGATLSKRNRDWSSNVRRLPGARDV